MKVLLYADFRSPHARGWRDGLIAAGIDVRSVSSERVDDPNIMSPDDSPSKFREEYVQKRKARPAGSSAALRKLSSLQLVHSVVQLVRFRSRVKQLINCADVFQPDVVHALRVPYEGITALACALPTPIVVSSWGLDFVPQASADPILRKWIRSYLPAAAGFQYDSPLDLERAHGYGLRRDIPSLHAAGNFGIDSSLFYEDPGAKVPNLVVYARKASSNCNYFGFIEAALRLIPSCRSTFVGVGLEHLEDEVVRRFGAYDHSRLQLTAELDRECFASLVRSAQIIVSPSYADGMPNTVLEAAACGATIVAGDLPQLRELADAGASIKLIDAGSTDEIAAAIERQLQTAQPKSTFQLRDEYSRSANVDRTVDFYRAVLKSRR